MPTPLPRPLLPRALLLPQAVQRQALQHAVPPAVLPRPALPAKVPQTPLPAATQGQYNSLCVPRQLPHFSMGVCDPKEFACMDNVPTSS